MFLRHIPKSGIAGIFINFILGSILFYRSLFLTISGSAHGLFLALYSGIAPSSA